jgi:hypothetical protein
MLDAIFVQVSLLEVVFISDRVNELPVKERWSDEDLRAQHAGLLLEPTIEDYDTLSQW